MRKGMLFKKKEITSFETVYLRISAMRYMHEYEIIADGEKAKLLFYENAWADEERIPLKQILCSKDEILQLLNDCAVFRWDGFFGKHPRNVSDGEVFLFQTLVNEGEKIRAEGSENFPKHYSELKNGLRKLLDREEIK
ncbi:MAG: hypothetical protein J5365_03395 [Erysipelotrichaceae bacterium]|nr:hypothetical protein [Erysipelotrichaceae bacterium]